MTIAKNKEDHKFCDLLLLFNFGRSIGDIKITSDGKDIERDIQEIRELLYV